MIEEPRHVNAHPRDPSTSPWGEAGGPPVASVWRRVAAYLLDVIPIVVIVSAVFWFFFGFDDAFRDRFAQPDDADARQRFLAIRDRVRLVSFIVLVLYGALMEGSPLQATLGKRVLGMKVVDQEGRPLSMLAAAFRNSSKLISYLSLGLGFLWAAFSRKGQTWHDKIAGTLVVSRDPAR